MNEIELNHTNLISCNLYSIKTYMILDRHARIIFYLNIIINGSNVVVILCIVQLMIAIVKIKYTKTNGLQFDNDKYTCT